MTWKISNTPIDPDPYYGAVSLLLHGDGTNGSTTIIDSSSTPKTVTAFGNAQISTAQSKFGGSSLAFDGSTGYLTVPSDSNLSLGSGDFTVEAWIWANSFFNYAGIVGNLISNSTTTWLFTLMTSGVLRLQNWNVADISTGINAVALNTWTHVAAVRNGNVGTIYVNGISAGTSTRTPINYETNSLLSIGRAYAGTPLFNGYIDDLRITKGVARYTSNFTPPTAPFPNF